jgi:hypothetical protein
MKAEPPLRDETDEPPLRNETDAERSDRNWTELLAELRVTQTGIQILSGFLLILPFQQRFERLDHVQRGLFLLALCLSTVATGLVLAPVSWHRLLFRRNEKTFLVTMADRLAKAGLLVLAMTLVVVLALIFSFAVGTASALIVAVLASAFFVLIWVVLPTVVLGRERSARARRP